MNVNAGISRALAALVGDAPDVADVFQHLVDEAAADTGAGSAAILADSDDRLTLVSATSHRASELEMLQAQHAEGPCVEAIRRDAVVRSVGADDLRSRWPEVGAAVVRAGFHSVEAFPVRWRGRAVAGLNLFFPDTPSPDLDQLKQAYADATALTIATGTLDEPGAFARHLEDAIEAREVVELAKGVLAEQEGVSMAEAYDLLLRTASRSQVGVTATAHRVVDRRGLDGG